MTDPRDPRDQDGDLSSGDLSSGDLPSGGELTEAEEREVTALLADLAAAGGPSTTPPTVVARLDAVLDDLLAERGADPAAVADTQADPRPGTVLPLSPPDERRRAQRRRRLTRTLLAAAAVVVGGYTVTSTGLIGAVTGSGGEMSSGAGESTAGSADSGPQAARADRDRADGTDSKALPEGELMSVVPTVREERLAADVRRVVRLFDGRGITDDPGDDRGELGGGTAEETRDCPVPRLTEEQQLYEVRFRGDRAGLVVDPEQQDRVRVTIYSCRTGGVQLTRTVPAP